MLDAISCNPCLYSVKPIITRANQLTILTKGINKGKSCNRPNCFYHKKAIIVSTKAIIVPTEANIVQQEKCKVLIKTGFKKGIVCNRLNCKYHKVKSIIV